MSGDNKYGFVELFSANVAAIAMSLNGLQYNGSTLRIARPKTYSEQYNGVSNISGASSMMGQANMGVGGNTFAPRNLQNGPPQGMYGPAGGQV